MLNDTRVQKDKDTIPHTFGTLSAKYNLNTGRDWHTYITAIYKYGYIMENMQVYIFTNCSQVMALSSAFYSIWVQKV